LPSTPGNLAAIVAGSDQINLYWDPSTGATQYIVERSVDGGNWTVLATGVVSVIYSDTDLLASTDYAYRVIAASGAGESAASATASAVTDSAVDTLSVQSLNIAATRKTPFVGGVATFTDANTLTAAVSFVATIHWGDGRTSRGTVSGGDGDFTVIGRHTYSATGHFAVKVTVKMSSPVKTGTSTSIAKVVPLARPSSRRPTPEATRAGKPRGKTAFRRDR
jgi:hypothetical protein